MTAVADRIAPRPGPQVSCGPATRRRAGSPARRRGAASCRSVFPDLPAGGIWFALTCVGAAAASVSAEPRILIAAVLMPLLAAMPLARRRRACVADTAVREVARVDPLVPAVTLLDVAGAGRAASEADVPAPLARVQDAATGVASTATVQAIAVCDAAEAVAFAMRLLEAHADRAGVRLHCEIDASIPLAACAQRDCRSAALSLIRNALRISGPGDTVRIVLRAVRGAVLLRVAAEARQDRGDAVEALAVARELLEGNGGSLFVEGGPGCATAVSVRLARVDVPVMGPAAAQRCSSPAALKAWTT